MPYATGKEMLRAFHATREEHQKRSLDLNQGSGQVHLEGQQLSGAQGQGDCRKGFSSWKKAISR